MIQRDDKTLFGGRQTEIHTPSFRCVVSTEREGLFSRLATLILDGEDESDERHPVCGKICYERRLGRGEIYALHELIVETINHGGRKGIPLGVVLQDAFERLKKEGLASETVNTAAWG